MGDWVRGGLGCLGYYLRAPEHSLVLSVFLLIEWVVGLLFFIVVAVDETLCFVCLCEEGVLGERTTIVLRVPGHYYRKTILYQTGGLVLER